VRLWFVGTDTAKDTLFNRLKVTQPGAGYVHFSKDLPPEFYHQLTSEARVPVRVAGGVDYRWVNTKRARNEALDCTVYALFCSHAIGLHVRNDREWDLLEEAVQPKVADLFGGQSVIPAARLPSASRSASVPSPRRPPPTEDWNFDRRT